MQKYRLLMTPFLQNVHGMFKDTFLFEGRVCIPLLPPICAPEKLQPLKILYLQIFLNTSYGDRGKQKALAPNTRVKKWPIDTQQIVQYYSA